MKPIRILKRLTLLSILILVLILCHGLNFLKEETAYEKRFTFISPITDFTEIASGIKNADIDFHTSTKLLGSEKSNMGSQIEAIRDTILTKPDGIITASNASKEFANVIQLAEDEGIPVILVDSDLPDSGRSCYIGTDNAAAGKLACEDIYAASGGSAKIGIVVTYLNYPSQLDRVNAFKKQLKQYDNMSIIEILECHCDELEVLDKIPDMLKRHPEMDALFLADGLSSGMVGDIIKEDEFASRKLNIVAFDDTKTTRDFVADGSYYSVISQNLYMQGYLAIQTLCNILDHNPSKDIIYTDIFSIRSDTLDTPSTWRNEELEWYLY